MSKMDVAVALFAFCIFLWYTSILRYKVESVSTEHPLEIFMRKLCPILPRRFGLAFTSQIFIFSWLFHARYLNAHRHLDLFFLITIPNGTSTSLQNMIYANTSPYYMDSSKFHVVILSDNYVPIRTGQIARRHMRTCNDFGELCVQNTSQRNYCN